MGASTKIQWTDASWNPVRGCSRVSEGCTRCYAERVAARFSGEDQPYEGLAMMTKSGPRWTNEVRLVPEHLNDPLRWKRPRRVFVNSMADLFHEKIPFETIDRIFAVMASCTHHQFQVLTKRPERMLAYFEGLKQRGQIAAAAYEARMRAHFEQYKTEFKEGYQLPSPPTPELRAIYDSAAAAANRELAAGHSTHWRGFPGGEYHWRPWPLTNVWLGVSCEDQATADSRIPILLQTPAAVHWVSAEPLLGPINLRWDWINPGCCGCPSGIECPDCPEATGLPYPRRLSWLVSGGESGPGARPMHPDWARQLRDDCASAGVPYFFKQWGEHSPNPPENARRDQIAGWPNSCQVMWRVGKHAAGRLLDGREHNAYPGEETTSPLPLSESGGGESRTAFLSGETE